MTEDQDDAQRALYRERAHLVAYLAAVYPSHVGYTDGRELDWVVATIRTPTGQMCWHISPDDMDLFDRVPWVSPTWAMRWDGHTTEEKYQRLRELTEQRAAGALWRRKLHPEFQERGKEAATATDDDDIDPNAW